MLSASLNNPLPRAAMHRAFAPWQRVVAAQIVVIAARPIGVTPWLT
jgi:hypothetical protein